MPQYGSNIDLGTCKIINSGTASAGTDVPNLSQVQTLVSAAGRPSDSRKRVRVASTGNVNISSPGSSIDNVTLSNGDRVLLKNQTTASQNGPYIWNGAAVSMTRASTTDDAINANATWPVSEGTANADTSWWILTNDPIVVDTTALTFSQFGVGAVYTGSGNIDITANVVTLTGQVGIANGGTGANTLSGAKTALGIRSIYDADSPALTAGVEATITHNLNIAWPVSVLAWNKTTGYKVDLDWRKIDSNSLGLKADIAYSAAALRLEIM